MSTTELFQPAEVENALIEAHYTCRQVVCEREEQDEHDENLVNIFHHHETRRFLPKIPQHIIENQHCSQCGEKMHLDHQEYIHGNR